MSVVDPSGDDDTSKRTSPYSVRAFIIVSPGNRKHVAMTRVYASSLDHSLKLSGNGDYGTIENFI